MSSNKSTAKNSADTALARLAQEKLANLRSQRVVSYDDIPLLDFVPAVTPRFTKPEHLSPIVPFLEAALDSPQFVTLSAPPRHGKSELLFHFMAKFIAKHPDRNVAFASYSAKFAERKSMQVRDICQRAGVALDKSSAARGTWRTQAGGYFFARGPGGDLTGEGIHLLVCDDPYRSRGEAESATIRDNIYDWWTSVAMTRLEPGASVVCSHCIAKGEPILMADGTWKAVEDVRTGDMVRSFESGGFVDRRVLGSKSSGFDPIYEVKTARKTVRANARHPFLLESGEWRKLGELKVGDSVRVVDTGTGFEGCDPEWAWFLGFMLGDGWVTTWERKNKTPSGKISKSRSYCVCVAKSEYPELNERVQAAIERFFGRRPKLTKFGYYRLDSNSAGRTIIDAGVTGGAWGKRIPQWIYRLNPELKVEFLRGYVDADGNCNLSGRETSRTYTIASVSEALIEDTRKLAMSAGVRVGSIKSSTQLVHAPHSAAPKLSTIFKASLNFQTQVESTEQIVSIAPVGRSEVFDLMVDGAENFVAGGFVVHNTRWHMDDLTGKLTEEQGWPNISIPAIDLDGNALWPERYTLEDLTRRRKVVGEYDWASMYMCSPRPRGGALFGSTTTYTDEQLAEVKFVRYVIGIDLAYTSKTYSDFSVAVVLGIDEDGDAYVVDVRRKQCQAKDFAVVLKELRLTYRAPHPTQIIWFTGGTEKAIAEFFRNSCGVPVKDIAAKDDKFVRAQAAAAAWNTSRILVPGDPKPWLDAFLSEVLGFTGIGDSHDDQVDALAAAFFPLSTKRVKRGVLEERLLSF